MKKNIRKLFNIDCFEWMKDKKNHNKIDIVLTSPPYNTGRPVFGEDKLKNHEGKYDIFLDNKTNDEYCDWTVNLFNNFNVVLKTNGVVLYNMSYSSENTECMFLAISDIIRKTPFTLADVIVWKKKNALPNNVSSNKLTRIVEFVFVFCRKNEFKTFNCNKKITSVRSTGQKMYEPIYNFFEAKNNDGSCSLNKATFSSEFVETLLKFYANKDSVIFDPFSGTGTTMKVCYEKDLEFYGTELSEQQCKYAKERIEKLKK